MTDAAHTVASHYNARPQIGVDARQESSIIHLKNLHNWIKSVLIRKYMRRGAAVLDFCCGKGGDLQKWIKADIRMLVGVDIARVSIDHAIERCRERNPRFAAKFFAVDCFVDDLVAEGIVERHSMDLVSCQFALHYSAENERKLEDAIDDCPEYVYHFPTFLKKAAERGLELVYERPFHELFEEEIRDRENLSLLYRMRVVDENGTISADEWEVSGLYKAVAMRKI
ncbi:mRNA cap guanine-N7 methyltransferase [Entophlyctis luteolus]|nr:mRNA cap guanine-N7 methyltransferase [Entophlyctis luteolus]